MAVDVQEGALRCTARRRRGPYLFGIPAAAAADAIERALRIHHAQPLPAAMGYFVRADNPALAAQVADRLTDEGLAAVFVVTRQHAR